MPKAARDTGFGTCDVTTSQEGPAMATTLAQSAIQENAAPDEVAKAAAKDATAAAKSQAEKDALALALYKEASGRFPQDSSDRKAVYTGGFVLVGVIFVLTMVVVVLLILAGKAVPEGMSILATALGSGIIGGLFGYAKQG
jgi:hypothetical protein